MHLFPDCLVEGHLSFHFFHDYFTTGVDQKRVLDAMF
jgi:hypothetical protein